MSEEDVKAVNDAIHECLANPDPELEKKAIDAMQAYTISHIRKNKHVTEWMRRVFHPKNFSRKDLPTPILPRQTDEPTAHQSLEIGNLAEKAILIKEEGRAKYREADEVLLTLIPLMKPEEIVTLSDGSKFKIKDNFAESNVAYRPAGVNRFELVPLTKKELDAL